MAKSAATLARQAWAIHSILQTLHAALPDDPQDCDVPMRCLVSHLMDMTEPLATELMSLEHGGV